MTNEGEKHRNVVPYHLEPVSVERFRRLELYREGEREGLTKPQLPLEEHLRGLERRISDSQSDLNRREAELAITQTVVEGLNRKLDDYKRRLDEKSDGLELTSVRAHLRALKDFWPGPPKDKIDEDIIRLVTHPDFIEIYRNTLVIKNPLNRHEYLLMRGLKLGLLDVFVDYHFFDRLGPLGLNITCPYLRIESGKSFDKCLIDREESIDTLCRGGYDACAIFRDRTKRFSTGELEYVTPPRTYRAPELMMSEDEREDIEKQLLNETESFWRGEDDI